MAQNPNPERGEGHWIHYDLGGIYRLGMVHAWNTNDVNHLDRGMRDVVIDYSTDGENWTELGEYIFPQASGSSIYEGFEAADFAHEEVRYIVITSLSNWGAECYGLSEMRFEVIDYVSSVSEAGGINECFEVDIFPNPHVDRFTAVINSTCGDPISYRIIDGTGRELQRGEIRQSAGRNELQFSENLAPGVYHLVVQQGENVGRYAIIRATGIRR